MGAPVDKNLLIYGDNLEVMRGFPDAFVDLAYLDPPFNSNRDYAVLFRNESGDEAQAQIEAFEDTWHWSLDAEAAYDEMLGGGVPHQVATAIEAMRALIGTNDVLAYLVAMTPRLVELHRVLKPTGSIWLHCDPTASHYLKVMLDAIFGPANFRNEVIWQRVAAKGGKMTRLPANHDVILTYAKSANATWNEIRLPYDPEELDEKTLSKYRHHDPDGRRYRLGPLLHPEQGRRPNLEYELMGVTRTWRWSKDRMEQAVADGRVLQSAPGRVPQQKMYLDEQPGRLVSDVWADISVLNSRAAERLGYPTQKPVALLERIITAASNPGDLVLDPFCGCGTTVDAAQKLGRRWIGIDITFLAVDLIEKRLRDTHGDGVVDTMEVRGIPRDVPGAQALFDHDPFDFERWAVSLVGGQPNEKQVGDQGADGLIRFPLEGKKSGRVVVSVKGGQQINPSMVRDLAGTVDGSGAQMGVLVLLREPTSGMRKAAVAAGSYTWPVNGQSFPKVQIITVEELLSDKRPALPPSYLPYVKAQRLVEPGGEQLGLLG